jgi:predicted dehydrogenase
MTTEQNRRSFLKKLGLSASAIPFLGATANATNLQSIIPYKGKQLGVALVGLGNYATNRLAVGLEETEHCKLAGIVTGTPAKKIQWQKKYGIADEHCYTYGTFENIANDDAIDVIYIVLPNSMHPEYVKRAAKLGKHIICEKPLANSVKEAEEMIAACEATGVDLAVGYRMHFEPFTIEAMRIGQNEEFGKINYMNTDFGFKIGDPTQWRLKKDMAGGGPLMDVGIYCVQAARYITGKEPISVTAQFGPVTDLERFSEVEESISWQFQFDGGGPVVSGYSSYKTNVERLYMSAANGWMELSPAYGYGPIKGETHKGMMDFPVVHQQANQLDSMAKNWLDGKRIPNHASGEEGLRDVKILMAIYDAAETGKSIKLS